MFDIFNAQNSAQFTKSLICRLKIGACDCKHNTVPIDIMLFNPPDPTSSLMETDMFVWREKIKFIVCRKEQVEKDT